MLGALFFALCRAIPGLVLPALALLSQGGRRSNVFDDFLLAAYLVAMSSLLSTVGFVVPIAFSATWRRLAVSRAIVIAGGLGLVAPIAGLFVMAPIAGALLPLFRSTVWLATALFHGLPGIVLGGMALLIVRLRGVAARDASV
jgi:hypothetical protein